MSSKLIQTKLKHDSSVFNNTYGFGNTRGLIKDNSKRLVKFKDNAVIELNVTDLTFIPYNIDSYIYYDNEPHKVIDLLLSNDVVSYRLSDIEGNSPYKLVNIADKKITNKLKKTKEKQPAISNNNYELPEIIMEMSQQPKNKYAVLLSQRYNKMVEQLNKTSKF